jgi:hypothetical protein
MGKGGMTGCRLVFHGMWWARVFVSAVVAAVVAGSQAGMLLGLLCALTIGLAALHVVAAKLLAAHWPRAAAVRPAHKVLYVVADVTKAAVLLGMMCTPVWWRCAWHALAGDGWEDPGVGAAIRAMVVVYTATDASQFLSGVVMESSTVQHHVATSLFGVYVSATAVGGLGAVPGAFGPLTRALIWYGMCSTVAYAVNLYKALRVLYGPGPVMEALRRTAACLYAAELAVNWPMHTAYIVRAALSSGTTDPVGSLLAVMYAGVTAVLMRDDVKLLTFLRQPGKIPPWMQPAPAEAPAQQGPR